jgi:hypothetical protein
MARLRLAATASMFLVAALAGCTGTDPGGPGPAQPPLRGTGPYRLDCGISDWNETCLAHASPNDSPSKAEIDVAVNPTDPRNVFMASKDLDRQASSCVWAVGQYTKDGGRHWNTTYVGGAAGERGPSNPLYGWQCITDPILQFEPDGTLHYSLQAYRDRPNGAADPTCALPTAPTPAGGVGGCSVPELGFMFQAVSHDGGATFPQIFILHGGDETLVFDDYMRMGSNPRTGTVFTIWNQITGLLTSEPVLVAVEHGSTRARPPVYFPTPDFPMGLGESSVVGAKDGTIYAWLSGFNSRNNAGEGVAVLAASANDGLTFGTPRQVWTYTPMDELKGAKFRTGTSVELAVDTGNGPRAGCLYAVWGGREADVVGPSDVYLRTSCDQGSSWSMPHLINSVHREDGQWMPRVSVDGRGTVHVVYMTRAYDPRHVLLDAEHAYSTDGGATWTQERLTGTSFDGDKGIHQDGFPFIGDYIGISSVGDDTWMGFPTAMTGRAEIAAAHSLYAGNVTA